jgi:hypothetical protein
MLSRAGDGWFAEIEVNGFGLRLVCIETGAGIAVNVYSHKDQRWAAGLRSQPCVSRVPETFRSSLMLVGLARFELATLGLGPLSES